MNTITMNTPIVRPLGLPLDKAEFVHEVWDAYVPQDDAPQSAELRLLMAILRSLHDALHAATPCTVCPDGAPA